MKYRVLVLAFAVVLGCDASPRMTNEDVVKLVNAGLSQQAIATAIRQQRAIAFDLTADGLISLKNAGVSDSLIGVMQDRSSASSTVAAQDSPSKSGAASSASSLPPNVNDGTLARPDAAGHLEALHGLQVIHTYIVLGNDRDDKFLRAPAVPQQQLVDSLGPAFRRAYPEQSALRDQGILKVALVRKDVPNPVFTSQLEDHFQVGFSEFGVNFFVGEYPAHGGECSLHRCAKLVAAIYKGIEILGVSAPAEGFGQVTSIVDYNLTWERTPAGEAIGYPRSTTERKQQAFVKYDDGWRVMKQ